MPKKSTKNIKKPTLLLEGHYYFSLYDIYKQHSGIKSFLELSRSHKKSSIYKMPFLGFAILYIYSGYVIQEKYPTDSIGQILSATFAYVIVFGVISFLLFKWESRKLAKLLSASIYTDSTEKNGHILWRKYQGNVAFKKASKEGFFKSKKLDIGSVDQAITIIFGDTSESFFSKYKVGIIITAYFVPLWNAILQKNPPSFIPILLVVSIMVLTIFMQFAYYYDISWRERHNSYRRWLLTCLHRLKRV